MFKRKYIFSCQVCHANGTGDKEYWNGVITTVSFFKLDAESLIVQCREITKDILDERVDRPLSVDDIQVLALNKH